MKPAELERDLAAGKLQPVYLFYGQDAFLKERYLARLTDLVQEGLRDFNLQHLSAEEIPPVQVLEQAKTMPFISPPRVIVLKGVDRYSAEELRPFQDYLQDPNESTCLVLTAEKPDLRLKFFKSIREANWDVVFEAPKGRDLLSWVKTSLAERGQEMTEAAARELIERIGPDLMELDQELEKISLYALEKKRVGVDEVKAAARLSHKASVFKLGDSVGRQDVGSALAELADLLLTEHHLPVLLMLVRHFRLLLKAKLLLTLGRGRSQAEAAAVLKVPPFAARQYLDQAEKLSLAEMKKGLRRLLKANLTLITSPAPARLVMENLVLDLASLRPNRRSGR